MRYGDNLAAHIVIDPIDGVGVDETVTDPQASFHLFGHFAQDLFVERFQLFMAHSPIVELKKSVNQPTG